MHLQSASVQACVLALLCCGSVSAWDQRELDMYDLIEEVGMKPDFYEILGLTEVKVNMIREGMQYSFVLVFVQFHEWTWYFW